MIVSALAAGGMAAALAFAVWRTVVRPPEGDAFDEALKAVSTANELSVTESALTVSDGNKEKWTWHGWWLKKALRAGREPDDPKGPGNFMLVVVIVLSFFGFFVFPTGIAGFIVPTFGILIALAWSSLEEAKRRLAMEKQLALLLSSLRSNIYAGLTVQSAVIKVADDMPAPLGDELRIVRDEVSVAVPLSVALQRMSERVGSRLVQFLISSIGIAIESGSDIIPQLVTIEEIVRQRARINGKIRAAVALAKPTAYLALGAPILMFFYMLFTQDNYLSYFLGPGIFVGIIAVFLYLAGAVVVRFMVSNVEKI